MTVEEIRLARQLTAGTAGWATIGCGAGNFGVPGQANRDPAFARSGRSSGTVKAPSPLRFTGALQKSRVSPILRTPLDSGGELRGQIKV